MIFTILIGIVVALLAGLALKRACPYLDPMFQITWTEFAIGAAVCSLLIVPGVAWAGGSIAKANKLTYHEWWGGYETGTSTQTFGCFRYRQDDASDSCEHHYTCGSYEYTYYTTETVTDANGSHTESVEHTETHSIYCPETNHEISYYVDTTLGQYTVGDHLLPPHPFADEYHADGNIPADLLATAHVPAFWAAAKQRVDSHDPGPATKRHDYTNYILASQDKILTNYSSEMDQYLKAGLLPKVQTAVHDFYWADKVYFVAGANQLVSPAQQRAIQFANNSFNAALGGALQGDLHVVVVPDSNPLTHGAAKEDFFNALMAYWQSPKLGKDDISKNAIVIALGIDSFGQIAWSKAATGMPEGNEGMIVALNQLAGRAFNVGLWGHPRATAISGHDVKYTPGQGALAQIILTGPTQFQRVSMGCHTPSKEAKAAGKKAPPCIGFSYLGSQIQPSTGQKVGIFCVALLICLVLWAIFAVVGAPALSPATTRLGRMAGRYRFN